MGDRRLEEIARTLAQFEFPKKITFELCSECNLRCVMCFQPTMRRPRGVMPFELWRKCADEIARVSPATDCWFSMAGEPLLEPDLLCRMVTYGKSVGLESVNLNSNGMLLTPHIAGQILDSGLDIVVIGTDGFTKDTYERIRVGGDRDRLYSNVEHLLAARERRERGPEIQLQFIEMPENQGELEDFTAYWTQRGAVVKARRMLSWGGTVDSSLTVPSEARIPCPWAINLMDVFWDGRVPRCPGDVEGEGCVGNVWEDSLQELWGRLRAHRQLHLDRRFEELPDLCQDCKDWMTGASEKTRG